MGGGGGNLALIGWLVATVHIIETGYSGLSGCPAILVSFYTYKVYIAITKFKLLP